MKYRLVVSMCMFIAVAMLPGCSKGVEEGAPVSVAPPSSAPTAAAYPQSGASSAANPAAPAAPDDGTSFNVLGLGMPKPSAWVDAPLQNQMQSARLLVPGEGDAGPADIVYFYFGPGQGGDVRSNIARWTGQFMAPDGGTVEPQVSEFEVHGMAVTMVELEGVYQGMGMPQPQPGMLFLSPIIEAPVGRVFIRLVGPKATVEANREAFMAMINGLQPSTGG